MYDTTDMPSLHFFLFVSRPFLYGFFYTVLNVLQYFIICAIIAFLFTNKEGKRIMVWKQVQGKIVWDLMYIFAGGLALGSLINATGVAKALGEVISSLDMKGGFVTILIILTATLLLSDVTSNTATAAVAIPTTIRRSSIPL